MSLLAGKVLNRSQILRVSLPISRITRSSFATPSTTLNDQSSKERTKTLRDIPGPSMVENLARLARDGFRYHHLFVEEMFERYGPIFRHSFPFTHLVYVSDPEDIEHVFRSQEPDRPYHGDNLISHYSVARGLEKGISGDDETALLHRRIIAGKLLLPGAIKPYFSEIVNVTDDTISSFKDGSNSDLKLHLTKWAAESTAVILFGLRIGANTKTPNDFAIKFIDATMSYFDLEAELMLGIPVYKHIETPRLRQAYRLFDVQMETTSHFFQKTMNESTELARASMTYRLMKEDDVGERTTIQICNNLFLGGIHTTANSLLNLIHNVSKHPEVQQKAYDEIQQVLGDDEPTYEHLTKMPYLKAMVKESFRYNTNPIGNLRETKLPVNVRGYSIPPGTRVVLSTIASKEMQKQKYGNPEKFSPERWSRSAEERMHPFSNLPFSFGKRSCAGKRIAELEMAILMVRLLQKYEILENKDEPAWVFKLVVSPVEPYSFYIKKRK